MKSTAEVATGQYPKISSDDVKQLSSNFMKVETDQDRDVQDTFQMAACRHKRAEERPCEQVGKINAIAPSTLPPPAAAVPVAANDSVDV
mmetsp:Transcript_13670/g.25046  ORF Transcript_13670/g.25046 Transcript_13670/m.25046 type:complete len:89 (-) Transcript_13670:133-399(-)